MYSKIGGKTSAHAWVPEASNIGSLSYIGIQTYQYSHLRRFNAVHRDLAALGGYRFEHSPGNSFLALIQTLDAVSNHETHLELDITQMAVYRQLCKEREGLVKAVVSLNTIRRKGQSNVSLLALVEEDGVES